ncbi:MAG: hypothetical protein PHE06_07980 [Lachnospiraceae bacterium]|nr:hypothetical protein [Lachnospiraceae bacterium]MDD3795890.1 hypothetical protein [Lachnospiraceae bacterium]
MLKFQNNHTTFIATFEDFITLTFTVIDDLYQEFVPAIVSKRRNYQYSKMTDSEIITIAICGELAGVDSENEWYSLMRLKSMKLLLFSVIYSIFKMIFFSLPIEKMNGLTSN